MYVPVLFQVKMLHSMLENHHEWQTVLLNVKSNEKVKYIKHLWRQIFTSIWIYENVNICPVYKKSDNQRVDNCRLVLLLPILA